VRRLQNISAVEAATLQLFVGSAYQAIFACVGLDPDDESCNCPVGGPLRVLVTNASSDVCVHAISLLHSR
jgi:NADPH:quinone reductase-like Zn-dependent oxidoreductase